MSTFSAKTSTFFPVRYRLSEYKPEWKAVEKFWTMDSSANWVGRITEALVIDLCEWMEDATADPIFMAVVESILSLG